MGTVPKISDEGNSPLGSDDGTVPMEGYLEVMTGLSPWMGTCPNGGYFDEGSNVGLSPRVALMRKLKDVKGEGGVIGLRVEWLYRS